MERERALRAEAGEQNEGKLDELGPAQIPWLDGLHGDIVAVIRTLIARMFDPLPEKGVSQELAAEVYTVRRDIPPMVSLTQLWGVFPDETTTVDRKVVAAQRDGRLRILSVNLPELHDLVIEGAAYDEIIQTRAGKYATQLLSITHKNPDSTWFDRDTLFTGGIDGHAASDLVKMGFLTTDPSRPGVYVLSTPGQGLFLKLVSTGRKWLRDTLMKTNKRWRELPEDILEDKLSHTKIRWRQLRGISLEWILYESVGGGWIVGFQTPIGRGWKYVR